MDMKHSTAMLYTMFRKITTRILFTFALLLTAVGAKAADYVLAYVNGGTTYYLARNGTTAVQRVTTFDPTTCIWSCASNTAGTTAGTLNNSNTYGYLFQTVNSTRYFLGAPDADLALATNVPNNYYRWRTNGTYVYNRYSGTYSYYVNLANGVARNTTANTASNARPYEVTTSTVDATSTNPTINGADVLTATGNSTYTATGAAYRMGYTNYNFNSANHYVDANGNSFTGTPANATLTYTWSLESNSYATVNNSGVVTVSSLPQSDLTLMLTLTVAVSGGTPAAPAGTTLTASKEITIQGTTPSAPIINVSGSSVTLSTEAAGTTTIRYTLDGTDPTATSGTVYSGAIDLSSSTTSPVTIKAVTVRNGNASAVTTQQVTLTLPEPVITVDGSTGAATISSSVAGATIYYTTDGSTPTTSSSQYSGSLTGLTMMTTVNAIAVKDGWNNSPVASETVTIPSGTDGGTVTLFDYEPHSWSYYSDPECPVRSLSPADVKITYYGDGIVMSNNNDYTAGTNDYVSPGDANYVGGAKVNVGGENENTFIYYKTLERGDATQTAWTFSSGNQSSAASRCPYTPIPNPFQVRPTYGTRNVDANDFTGWRGFQCWRLKSVTGGAVYSAASGGTALAVNAIVNAETQIYFAPDSEYGMEVELEAVWARAYLVKGNNANANAILNYGNLGVERNFMTLTTNENYRFNGTSGRRITNVDRAVTISCYYPSGEAPDNTNGVVTGNNNNITLGADTKFENVTLSAASYTLTTSGHDVIIGRGCTTTNIGTVRGMSDGSTSAVDYTIRLESGTYGTFALIDNTARTFSSTVSTKAVFGSDYDRAKSDNNKLSIAANSTIYGGNAVHVFNSSSNRNNLTYDWLIKSGKVQGSKSVTVANADQSIYIGNSVNNDNTQYMGKRRFTMEGGEIASLAGSLNSYGNNRNTYMVNDGDAVEIRIKGGTIRGSVYGAAAYASATGNRRFVFTGGDVRGWIAGGANGTQSDGGYLYGSTKIYIGGKTNVNSNSSTSVINRAVGGNVFGAGCGYGAGSNSRQVTEGTSVVVADEAYVERGVYGGGSYGYTTATSNVYILGGTIDGKAGGVNGTNYLATIDGGVYGGACQNQGGTVNLTMKGGTVNGSVYGGSNYTGTLSGTSTVIMNGGKIVGSLYGGGNGKGGATNVTGAVAVKVYGGTVTDAVYGCNNVNGAPQSTVHVDIYGTDPAPSANSYALGAVFGGGNQANYDYGTPTVKVHNCDNSIAYVYGGGNAAHITNGNTDVTIYGGNKIGNVFGGGNGQVEPANISGNTNVKIYGGTIGKVFGGSNSQGNIGGTINVTVVKQAGDSDPDGSSTACAMHIDEVYGGGNMAASNAGNISIGCTGGEGEGIGDVYGGANAANITGDIALNITGGSIERVFGGNNASGSISGGIQVDVNWATTNPCGYNHLGSVFGAGNLAQYTIPSGKNLKVNILNGTVSENVYGGGKGDPNDHSKGQVTGNPIVTIGDASRLNDNTVRAVVSGDVYGGGDAGNVEGVPQVNVINKCNTSIANVYGGGNAADVNGTDVNIDGGNITGMVFGGGHGDKNSNPQKQADVNGNVAVDVTGGTINKVFGGSNSKGSISGTVAVNIAKGANSCDMHITEVYGGGNEAAGNAGTITIGCTGDFENNGEGIGDVYGGANAADINNNISLAIRGGHIDRVFGGNNSSGSISGTIAVEVNWNDALTCGKYLGNVFGGGNVAAYTGTPTVTLTNGTVSHSVYGGGNEAGVGGSLVNINGGSVLDGVYGGCNTSGNVSGNIVVNINGGTLGTSSAPLTSGIFGGGYGSATTTGGNVTVNVGDANAASATATSTIYGDIYGGSALGTVNDAVADVTTVNINNGTIHGNIYGGGLGAATLNGNGYIASVTTEAVVNGTVRVNIGTSLQASNFVTIDGQVFGCNNLAGSPKGHVYVDVYHTAHTAANTYPSPEPANANAVTSQPSSAFAIGAVYGGGNLAHYTTTVSGASTHVTIHNCDNTIEYVYGGGNAASSPATEVKVEGGRFNYIFGGGNGAGTGNPGADILRDATATINGGIVYRAFGGSNTKGNIGGTSSVVLPDDNITCTRLVHEIFGGGNEAPGGNVDLVIPCGTTGTGIIYAGANNADMGTETDFNNGRPVLIKLTVEGGNFTQVFGGNNQGGTIWGNVELYLKGGTIVDAFGGNNLGGNIKGTIKVFVDEEGSCPLVLTNVYGGGYNAAYTPADATIQSPQVYVNHLKSSNQILGSVYGGG